MCPTDLPTPLLPARGTFLVASPRLLDPNFMHAVVLVCDHGPQGTYGVIVNRRGEITLSDLGSDAPLLKGRADRARRAVRATRRHPARPVVELIAAAPGEA
jgi:putative AlgH/UPF0301 family transcriptional regulator